MAEKAGMGRCAVFSHRNALDGGGVNKRRAMRALLLCHLGAAARAGMNPSDAATVECWRRRRL